MDVADGHAGRTKTAGIAMTVMTMANRVSNVRFHERSGRKAAASYRSRCRKRR